MLRFFYIACINERIPLKLNLQFLNVSSLMEHLSRAIPSFNIVAKLSSIFASLNSILSIAQDSCFSALTSSSNCS